MNYSSFWKPVLDGVPYGFVVDPLFLILNVNEPPSIIAFPALLYSDGVKIWRHIIGDADSRALQADLGIQNSWSKE